ncbi:hypothetical protein SteCoe_4934 [Stentor coeruleus]|uniref:Uncharacterized protein n=1 Tax=Stentor coeruleus TaxID=5963 RepID=A0A1R2CTQ4_9CILI|nr:hypothetical protein SteCoe_4934 [Stentor coeruleus]
MSRLIFPDSSKTEWIAWKKIGKRSVGIENSKFRWTSEKLTDYSSTLPFISISPLNIVSKPLKTTRKSCPRPFNQELLIELPPFSGSIKTRNIANLFSRSKNQGHEISNKFINTNSELVPKANFNVKPKSKSKNTSKRKIRYFLKGISNKNNKLEGIIGTKLLNEQESGILKTSESPRKSQYNGEIN